MLKLPRTLHIEGSRLPPGKSDPGAVEFTKLRGQFLVIEEKVDGSGVSIFLDNKLNVQVWHRGSPAIGKEYQALHEWAENHWEDLMFLLGERYILFGEWLHDKHTIFYDNLPHFFLESDIYDKERDVWLSTNARNSLIKNQKYIKRVPVLACFKPSSLGQITGLLGKSTFISKKYQKNLELRCQMSGANLSKTLEETDISGLMEGLYIKQENDIQVVSRYKYIRYDFLRQILDSDTHLRDRVPISNMISGENYTTGLL
jgi:RNA ligase